MFVGRSSNCRCQRIGLYIQKPVFSEFEFCYDRNGLSYSRGVEFGLGYSFLFLFSSLLFRLVIGQLKVSFWLVLIRVPNSDSKVRAFFQFALKVWLESIINSCTAAYRRILVPIAYIMNDAASIITIMWTKNGSPFGNPGRGKSD